MARRRFRRRVEVPVPAPRGSVELATRAARDPRALHARLLHAVLRPLAGERLSHVRCRHRFDHCGSRIAEFQEEDQYPARLRLGHRREAAKGRPHEVLPAGWGSAGPYVVLPTQWGGAAVRRRRGGPPTDQAPASAGPMRPRRGAATDALGERSVSGGSTDGLRFHGRPRVKTRWLRPIAARHFLTWWEDRAPPALRTTSPLGGGTKPLRRCAPPPHVVGRTNPLRRCAPPSHFVGRTKPLRRCAPPLHFVGRTCG